MRTAIAAGVVCGLAILTRTAIVLWLPGLMGLVMWLAHKSSRRLVPAAGLAAAFVCTALLVCTPWFVHNVKSLGAFMPLGSHIYTLPSGFSDRAWERGGAWYSLGDAFFAEVVNENDSPLVAARKQAQYGRDAAVAWILEHPLKTVILAARKAVNLWAPRPSIEVAYLLFPLIGIGLMFRTPLGKILGAFLVFNTLAVAATWTWEADRFLVPVLGLLHAAGAVGIWTAVTGARSRSLQSGALR